VRPEAERSILRTSTSTSSHSRASCLTEALKLANSKYSRATVRTSQNARLFARNFLSSLLIDSQKKYYKFARLIFSKSSSMSARTLLKHRKSMLQNHNVRKSNNQSIISQPLHKLFGRKYTGEK
jgi:hypothetical protein